ncbi:sucrose-phosphate synthase [Magnetococcus marinus MC-1]|uniref:sucrose-phosphate synthase n=1 Tax=Magnetococcus marinus (strain ATCC BAA-1437 / JCM 17883 / MC-1) TaxID=156889 RepID=A0LDF8_MAGMM|nr:HAD-IIB family hydrolase [Magnetococcus marinus]ABK46001.1 sucrose-phosphate synthase [Magnetococcus marinus MC-1]
MNTYANPLYLILISPHGLIRGENLELGRDADTGGQTKYVVELARALAQRPEVGRVDLLTRRVVDAQLSSDYAEPVERLSDKARIVRIECGGLAYLPKEQLWDSLDNYADNALAYIHEQPHMPHLIHTHYADAGYVGAHLCSMLEIPLIHTGHSLGRSKRKRLLAGGLARQEIEAIYNISRRIDAEERTLAAASSVVVSTHQEIQGQYVLYDYYQPDQMQVIPPGTDLNKFYAPQGDEAQSDIAKQLARFLTHPDKPIILALSRPDPRKNITTLVEAYGQSPQLQEMANLVIIAGNRDDIRDMDAGAQEVLTSLLMTMDLYDLYGKMAMPKHHQADDVPQLYRLAALSKGVFVNPALIEPFGLTLIEAAACGLPLVATEDGGPIDIVSNCKNGLLIDPLDGEAIAQALMDILSDQGQWQRFAQAGQQGVRAHYSWQAHVEKYLAMIQPLVEGSRPLQRMCLSRRPAHYREAAIITDLDQNLLGDDTSLSAFVALMRQYRKQVSFGIATGRNLESALSVMRKHKIPQPDVIMANLGTEVYYAPDLLLDSAWKKHINHLWFRHEIVEILSQVPGLSMQPKGSQSPFKISYYMDPNVAPDLQEINRILHQQEQTVNVIFSRGQFLDILPHRASKGYALRWVSAQLDIPLENMLVAGGSGADEDMMRGNTQAVVVGNRHDEELSTLAEVDKIYFAQQSYAAGIIEAIDHYDFFGTGKGAAS